MAQFRSRSPPTASVPSGSGALDHIFAVRMDDHIPVIHKGGLEEDQRSA
jgi:hypothetical protein